MMESNLHRFSSSTVSEHPPLTEREDSDEIFLFQEKVSMV